MLERACEQYRALHNHVISWRKGIGEKTGRRAVGDKKQLQLISPL